MSYRSGTTSGVAAGELAAGVRKAGAWNRPRSRG